MLFKVYLKHFPIMPNEKMKYDHRQIYENTLLKIHAALSERGKGMKLIYLR